MVNFLSKLTLEHWYKMLIAASFAVLIVALTMPMHGVSNNVVQLLALAGMAIGIGEWINHPLKQRVNWPTGITLSSHPRSVKPMGVLFLTLGALFMALGVWRLLVA